MNKTIIILTFFLVLVSTVFATVSNSCPVDVGEEFCGRLINETNNTYINEVSESVVINGSNYTILVNKTFEKHTDNVLVKGIGYNVNYDFEDFVDFEHEQVNESNIPDMDSEKVIKDSELEINLTSLDLGKKDTILDFYNILLYLMYICVMIIIILVSYVSIIKIFKTIKKFQHKRFAKKNAEEYCKALLDEGYDVDYVEKKYNELTK